MDIRFNEFLVEKRNSDGIREISRAGGFEFFELSPWPHVWSDLILCILSILSCHYGGRLKVTTVFWFYHCRAFFYFIERKTFGKAFFKNSRRENTRRYNIEKMCSTHDFLFLLYTHDMRCAAARCKYFRDFCFAFKKISSPWSYHNTDLFIRARVRLNARKIFAEHFRSSYFHNRAKDVCSVCVYVRVDTSLHRALHVMIHTHKVK